MRRNERRAAKIIGWSVSIAAVLLGCFVASLANAGDAPGDIPHLQKQGTATQLVVDGKPFLCLAGELHNSSGSSLDYMKPIWPRLVRMNLNTAIVSVSWELIEPTENEFDFSLVDGLVRDARENKLHLVFLWFGSWKNGLSSYPPLWVKSDPKRFPPAQDASGKQLDILSTLGEQTAAVDARAFAALMHHIKEIDGNNHTVVAMQVENEVGMRGDSRDRNDAANAAFAADVPKELMDFLQKNNDTLLPELKEHWQSAGGKSRGKWADVFGASLATDELFMAWHYATYVNKVAAAGKAEYPIPMYANCWLDQPGTPKPGDYPSGGPLAHLLDVWHAGAPSIDFVGPDLYVGEFADRCAKFTRAGNPLFIPETNTGDRAGVNALYAFGKHDAICFSPFGIDGFGFFNASADAAAPESTPQAQAYGALAQLTPMVLENQGKGTMTAVMIGGGALDENAKEQQIKLGGYTITARIGRRRFRPAATDVATTRPTNTPSGGIIISSAQDEFILLTSGLNLTFAADDKPDGHTAVASLDEGTFVDGKWIAGRRLNGDETDHDRDFNRALSPYRIYRIKLFQRP